MLENAKLVIILLLELVLVPFALKANTVHYLITNPWYAQKAPIPIQLARLFVKCVHLVPITLMDLQVVLVIV